MNELRKLCRYCQWHHLFSWHRVFLSFLFFGRFACSVNKCSEEAMWHLYDRPTRFPTQNVRWKFVHLSIFDYFHYIKMQTKMFRTENVQWRNLKCSEMALPLRRVIPLNLKTYYCLAVRSTTLFENGIKNGYFPLFGFFGLFFEKFIDTKSILKRTHTQRHSLCSCSCSCHCMTMTGNGYKILRR